MTKAQRAAYRAGYRAGWMQGKTRTVHIARNQQRSVCGKRVRSNCQSCIGLSAD